MITRWPRRVNLRALWWASVPVWSIGILSCVPFFVRAVATKRARDWAVTGVYFVGSAAMLTLASAGGSPNPSATDNTLDGIGGGIALLLMGIGAAHAAILFRQPALPLSTAVNANQAAIIAAQETVQRRAEARRIVETDPALARDLKIGRPELPRTYDDGGLVDVNHVSAEVLVLALDWTPDEAQAVIEARENMGGFSSSAELGVYTTISPDRLDAVADLLLFRRA